MLPCQQDQRWENALSFKKDRDQSRSQPEGSHHCASSRPSGLTTHCFSSCQLQGLPWRTAMWLLALGLIWSAVGPGANLMRYDACWFKDLTWLVIVFGGQLWSGFLLDLVSNWVYKGYLPISNTILLYRISEDFSEVMSEHVKHQRPVNYSPCLLISCFMCLSIVFHDMKVWTFWSGILVYCLE